MSGFTTR